MPDRSDRWSRDRGDDSARLVIFPEDVEVRRPRPSEMPTVRPGPSPLADRPAPRRAPPTPSAPVSLGKRAPRPGTGLFGRAGRRTPRAPTLPGDVRGAVRTRDRRIQRGRVWTWLAALVLLLVVPAAATALLVPGTWQWLVVP